MNQNRQDLAVVGGGVVGICAALFAQRAGFDVTLIDPREPGSQTSFGNAGIVCGGHYVPTAMPRAPLEILKLALNQTTYACYRPAALPGFLGWLAAFWKESAPVNLYATAREALPAMAHTVALHRKLLNEAGAGELLRDTGWLAVFRSQQDFDAVRPELDFARDAGIPFDVLSMVEARLLEPNLNPVFECAVNWRANSSVSDPFAVSQAYLKLFREAGGSVQQTSALSIQPHDDRWRVETRDGSHYCGQVVVAAGAWSMELLEPLGYRFPLKPKRGYHRHFAAQGNAGLARPVVDDAVGYVLAPMARGIRMTTGIELARIDDPVNEGMVQRVEPYARDLFPLAETLDDEVWMGRRPALPDSLPVVGPAPRHHGLWVDFGHAHLGLTLGPLTGLLLSQMLSGETPIVDPEVFSPRRYAG